MKRLLAFLVTVSIVLSCLSGISLVAFADEVEPLTRGTETISYDAEAGGYIIDTSAKFIAIFGEGNTEAATDFASGKVYLLTANVDLPANFVPAHGTNVFESVFYDADDNSLLQYYEALPFKGTLKGWDSDNGVEAFRTIDLNGTADAPATRPLVVCAEYLNKPNRKPEYNYFCAGGIFNEIYGATISHLKLEGNIAFYGLKSQQGYNYGTNFKGSGTSAVKVTFDRNVMETYATTVDEYCGVLYGNDNKTAVTTPNVTYVENYADATAIENPILPTITNATVNNETVEISTPGANQVYAIGGIGGNTRNVHAFCKNYGDITGSSYAAGIIAFSQGSNKNSVVADCYNAGNISAYSQAAGIVGYSYFNVARCANVGNISGGTSGTSSAGGIIGTNTAPASSSFTYYIKECFNAGNISGKYVGGIVGIFNTSATPRPVDIIDSYNIGILEGTNTTNAVVSHIYWTGATVASGANAYLPFEVTNFYDLSNKGIGLYTETTATATYENDITDAFVIGEANGTNTITLDTLKGDIYFTDESVWERDADSDYPYPTLVNNIYDNSGMYDLIPPLTPAKPFDTIANAEEFYEKITANPDASFKQTASFTVTMNEVIDSFKGTYDGNGYTITADLDFGSASSVGLFKTTEGATIKNLTFDGSVTSIGDQVGGIVGYAGEGTTLKGLKNKASVSGSAFVGGVVAVAYDAVEITDCHNEADGVVTGTYAHIGGVIGAVSGTPSENSPYTISNCTNKGFVGLERDPGTSYFHAAVGGVVGTVGTIQRSISYAASKTLTGMTVSDCHNLGTVEVKKPSTSTSTQNARGTGGVVGYITDGYVTLCSNSGNVIGMTETGGIIGQLRLSSLKDNDYGVSKSYNAGTVKGTASAAGIIGILWFSTGADDDVIPTISNCFNAGKIDSGSKYAMVVNYFASTSSDTGNVLVEGVYDTTGIRLSHTTDDSDVTYTHSYILNFNGTPNAGTNINEDGLKALTTTDSVFDNANVWYITTNPNNAYVYPQLVGNKEYVTAFDLTPYDVEIKYVADNYKLIWNGKGTPDGYAVKINNVELEGTTTEKELIITDQVEDTIVSVVVIAKKEGEADKASDAISFNGFFGGGEGTESSPYKVYTAKHFENIETDLDAWYIQEEDFERTEPICIEYNGVNDPTNKIFKGNYNGNQHKIKLTIDTGDATVENPIGLFGFANNATISNLTLTGSINVPKRINTGGITKPVFGATNTKKQKMGIGSFVGSYSDLETGALGSHFNNCVSYVDITSDSNYTAGIVGYGYIGGGTYVNCVNYGDIISTANYSAGITGINRGATYENCANLGNLQGGTNVGGITGHDYGGKYYDCYNVGTLSAIYSTGIAGGIIGYTNSRVHLDASNKGNAANAPKLYSTPQEKPILNNCFNAGAIVAPISCGIVYHPDTSSSAQVWGAEITNCYNLVTTVYPITNYTDEKAAEVLATVKAAGIADKTNSIAWVKNETATANLVSPPITNTYYIGSTDDGIAGTTPKTKDELKAQSITGFGKYGNYPYPQSADNQIPAGYDNIDVYLVTLTSDDNATASIKNFEATGFYVPNGTKLTVNVEPIEGYAATVTLGEDADLKTLLKKGAVSIKVPANDTTISVTTEALDTKFTGEFVNPEDGESATTTVLMPEDHSTPVTIYSETAEEEITISRYVVIAGSAKPQIGYTIKEYGVLTDLDNTITIEDNKHKFKGVKPYDESNGFFGILLYGDDQDFSDGKVGLQNDVTYYARPYVIYVDGAGNEYAAYGAVQQFVFTLEPVDAE